MLDFGSRMSKNDDHEDDLFSTVAEQPEPIESEEPEFEPEPVQEKAVSVPAAARVVNVRDDDDDAEEAAPVRFSFLRKAKDRNDEELEKLDTCKILRNARLEKGLSLEQVEAETQIRSKYLEALEKGWFDELPQQVYVLAYLRKLCRMYDISADDEASLVHPWRQMTREVPENLPASVIRDENNENTKVLRRLEFGLLAGGAIVVIGILAFLVILAVSFFNQDNTPAPKFNNNELLKLQEKPQLTVPAAEPVGTGR